MEEGFHYSLPAHGIRQSLQKRLGDQDDVYHMYCTVSVVCLWPCEYQVELLE